MGSEVLKVGISRFGFFCVGFLFFLVYKGGYYFLVVGFFNLFVEFNF